LGILEWYCKTCGLYYKSLRIVIYSCNDSAIIIYDRNDGGHYYKTINYIG
jgi:hypothetical protein